MVLSGMASDITRGLFYDITIGKEQGWSLHTWSAHDNPHVAVQWQEELDFIAKHQPQLVQTARFRQAYLNEWVVDEEKLVYKFTDAKNIYKQTPPGLSPTGWTYVLGVDTGWEDDNAFVLGKFHDNDPCLYIVRTYNKGHMTFDQVAEKIREFMAHPTEAPVKIIIDGANKQGVESMRARSSIPFEYADKIGKVDFIEMMNGDFVQGKIKINSQCDALVGELKALIWKTDGETIVVPKKEDPRLPNHLADAMLYMWRNGYHYQSEPAVKKIVIGSRGWYEKQKDGIWDRERERLEKEENRIGDGWPSDQDSGWSSL
jgi:phage terminase large subunit